MPLAVGVRLVAPVPLVQAAGPAGRAPLPPALGATGAVLAEVAGVGAAMPTGTTAVLVSLHSVTGLLRQAKPCCGGVNSCQDRSPEAVSRETAIYPLCHAAGAYHDSITDDDQRGTVACRL